MAFLSGIEQPNSIIVKIAYFLSRKQYGKVISPLKVIYSRVPSLLGLALKMGKIREKEFKLPKELQILVSAMTSYLNDCAFCKDLHLAESIKEKIGPEKMRNLATYKESSAFTEREKAALLFCEEITTKKKVSPETFASLKLQFSEVEIVELAGVIAISNYFNFLAIPMGLESDKLGMN